MERIVNISRLAIVKFVDPQNQIPGTELLVLPIGKLPAQKIKVMPHLFLVSGTSESFYLFLYSFRIRHFLELLERKYQKAQEESNADLPGTNVETIS